MAEMTALEFLKCKDRICRTCACNVCPIWRSRPDQSEGCGIFLRKYPEKAIAIVQKWSEEHPRKTLLEDFLEKYPKARLNEKGYPDDVCPIYLGYLGENFECKEMFDTNCLSCWNQWMETEE